MDSSISPNQYSQEPINTNQQVIESSTAHIPPTPRKKMPIIFGGLLVLLIAGSGLYYLGSRQSKSLENPRNQIATTASITPSLAPSAKLTSSVVPTVFPTLAVDPVTTNWKTYSARSYSFKYPDTWTNDNSSQKYFETGTLLHTKGEEYTDYSHFTKGAVIYRFYVTDIIPKSNPDGSEVTLDMVASENGKPQKGQTVIKETKFLIDGQPAIERSIQGEGIGEIFVAFQYPDNKGYSWLIMLSSPNEFAINQQTFTSMLSTFKFTK